MHRPDSASTKAGLKRNENAKQLWYFLRKYTDSSWGLARCSLPDVQWNKVLNLRKTLGGDSLLFHTFRSQEEREAFGGSYFIEFQYCRLPSHSTIEEIISVDSIHFGSDDSLYVYGDDDNSFSASYDAIFSNGIYSNGKTGIVDLCGINYYSVQETDRILKSHQTEQHPEQEVLASWLKKAKEHNGFYILGL